MAKKKEEKKVTMTRAQKTEATKGIIKELLAVKPMKHNELIEETARLYAERYASEETENANDVKGRAGSVLDIMKKESEVMYDGGMYALKARIPVQAPVETTEEKPVKKTRAKKETSKAEEVKEEKPAPKKRAKKTKPAEEPKAEEKTEMPVETAVEKPTEEVKAEPKKRGRKTKAKAEETPKAEPKTEEKPVEVKAEPKMEETSKTEPKEEPKTEMETPKEEVKEQPKEEPKTAQALTVKPKAEVAPKGVVMDMTFLIGDGKKAPKKEEPKKVEPKKEEPKAEVKTETPVEEMPKTESKPAQAKPVKESVKAPQKEGKTPPQKQETRAKTKTVAEKPLTADEKLRDAYLKRMRTLGGDYFEYYSVYLLERYSMKNGRRLESMRISGGGHDGGIDGEIELTDKFGFRETIYIQSKNWNPDKGKEESWVVGETLLQQFIGACACRQAKDGKQHCRGIFVTTSRFTPDAKRILEDMADKIVGYDGNDLYEAAKECAFGLVKKNGEWMLDEKLLSGTKAFFDML